mmetsp:Transcript_38312/g.108727  ORF Transcript_38312/g.108727 Transcript_38312/m.108727 type:complete len:202 (-) Transcript_38312:24-629(-)
MRAAERRQEMLHKHKVAQEVDLHDALEAVFGEGLIAPVAGNARVADQHVDLGVQQKQLRGEEPGGIEAGQVDLQGGDARVAGRGLDPPRRIGPLALGIPAAQDDRRVRRGEGQRGLIAKSVIAPGDDVHLPVETAAPDDVHRCGGRGAACGRARLMSPRGHGGGPGRSDPCGEQRNHSGNRGGHLRPTRRGVAPQSPWKHT